MSAIFGILGPHERGTAVEMGERLRHRGTGVDLVSFAPEVTLGAVGRRPGKMIHATGGLAVVADASFFDRSLSRGREAGAETRLLHRLFLEKDFDGIERINGDFAAVALDRSTGSIRIARDFFGCRPLYMVRLSSDGFAFASEYKALLAIPDLECEIDLDMVQLLQCAKRLASGRTLIRQIVEAPFGAVTEWRADGARTLHVFEPLAVDVSALGEDEAATQVRETLATSVRVRTSDQDRIGLALSGGIDSIILAFLLRKLWPEKSIYTFTACHGNTEHEAVTARKVAEAIGAVHHEIATPPELMRSELDSLVWHLEDPIARSESLQLLALGQEARGQVDVILSGQGADSLFAGMARYRLIWLRDRLPMFRRAFVEFYNLTQLGTPAETVIGRLLDYAKFRGKIPPVPQVVGATLPSPFEFPRSGPEKINTWMAQGFQSGQNQGTRKFDRTFGASGLEYRAPYCDLRVVRVAFTIPDRLKIRRQVTKYILRKAFESMVPAPFLGIRKYPQRMNHNLKFASVLDEVGQTLLLGESTSDRGIFENSTIEALFRDSETEPYADEAAMRIWTAMLTELWAQIFLDHRGKRPRQCFGSASGPPDEG